MTPRATCKSRLPPATRTLSPSGSSPHPIRPTGSNIEPQWTSVHGRPGLRSPLHPRTGGGSPIHGRSPMPPANSSVSSLPIIDSQAHQSCDSTMLNMKLCSAAPRFPSLRVLTLLFALLSSQATHAQDSFTRITSSPAVSGINSTILAWGDFNNDSFQDLFVSTRTGSSLLYSNK